jgi:hypothetical protein
MTFENDNVTYVHLVSWPSVWLPPPGTIKVAALGWTQSQIEQLAGIIQTNLNWQSVALYWVPDFDINNKEQIDWLRVNDHVSAIVLNGLDVTALTMALILRRQGLTVVCVGQAPVLDGALEQSGWRSSSFEDSWTWFSQPSLSGEDL